MSRRIVFIDHSSEPGGAELSLIDIAIQYREQGLVCLFQNGPVVELLRDRGIAFQILSTGAAALAVRRHSGIIGVLRAIPSVFSLAFRLRKMTRRGDILYANSQKGWVIAAIAAMRGGNPVIWHLRDIVSSRHFSIHLSRVAVFLANRFATRVIVNSRATGEAFAEQGGRRDLLQVVHNGIDGRKFEHLGGSCRESIRSRIGAGDSTVLVGAFGRLAEWKGQHVLLEAMTFLPEIKAIVVGDALFDEAAYLAHLKQLVDKLGLTERVSFLGHRQDIPELMNAVDVVVHTSIEPEPFGRVIVEGMLAGRPVIATEAGGVMEIIDDGVTGLLVPPNDPQALAIAIRKFVDDTDFASRIALAGKTKAIKNFSLDKMLNGVSKVILSLPDADTNQV